MIIFKTSSDLLPHSQKDIILTVMRQLLPIKKQQLTKNICQRVLKQILFHTIINGKN